MGTFKLIDNKRIKLLDVISRIAPDYDYLSIATGYWDILGSKEVVKSLINYKKIRLLIGIEPLYNPYINRINLEEFSEFPDQHFRNDLEFEFEDNDVNNIENTAKILTKLIRKGILEVKVFRNPRLHAKAYIFGNYDSADAVGIVGSSNFTLAGLTSNAELNVIENDYRIVTFKPQNDKQDHGHLSWFDELWESEEAVDWTGDFQKLIEQSPVGDMTFGAYDVYIKTLMELYPDEMLPPAKLSDETKDILYSFQNRNAGILINKLNRMKLAILSDSVGLGKTITAGAVIKHYLDKAEGKANILIIAPASIKQQWEDDLSSVLELERREGAFEIITQQDGNKIQETIDYYNKSWRKSKNIDLFVIDEAHNLRNKSAERYKLTLELLQQHPNAHILLITATPINNSLMDIANLIQLASKGRTQSVNVVYKRPNDNTGEMIDFFLALDRIQSALKRVEGSVEDTEELLEFFKPTIHFGLRNYLVRSTRQGVESEGGIIDNVGERQSFPISKVVSIDYQYQKETVEFLDKLLDNHQNSTFEGIPIRTLNLDNLSRLTQQTMHPLDFFKSSEQDIEFLRSFQEGFESKGLDFLYDEKSDYGLVPKLLQIIFSLGFTPYRPHVYRHRYYGKTIQEINSLDNIPTELKIQLTIHNILQITWLKRLESSPSALLISIKNYKDRIETFGKYLNKGYILSLREANLVEEYYDDGDDIEKAFSDYDRYLVEQEKAILAGTDPELLKKSGVRRRVADEKDYNIEQLILDLHREKQITKVLVDILEFVCKPEYDVKMQNLYSHINNTFNSKKYGRKVIIFSFFADTIKHLENNFHKLYTDDEKFKKEAAFIIGGSQKVENIVQKFSPRSKKYDIKHDENEINYLFATDTLSEGQNLQDSAYLINYDLHWNPVRMIQRNGRVNRLGSIFDEVLIGNMKPTDELELYLRLVRRLEDKIRTIKTTIGLDQGVLTSQDVNPIEFIEKYYTKGELPELEDDFLAHTDDHILSLRKFLGENKDNQEEIERIKSIPKGKWNYLPKETRASNSSLALINVLGETSQSHRVFNDLFFVEVDTKSEDYIAHYIDYAKALDYIKANDNENEVLPDGISLDKIKVKSRAKTEAKRQASNPENSYRITPQYERALTTILYYLKDSDSSSNDVDYKGIIELGVQTIDIKNKLERVLRKINKEQRENGSLYSTTLGEFNSLFEQIKLNVAEEKEISEIVPILFYANKL